MPGRWSYMLTETPERTHGTISCYQWELEQRIPTCEQCKEAARTARAKYRARHASTRSRAHGLVKS